METDLRLRAERAAADRLRSIRPHARFVDMPAGYLEDWADNLIDGVTPADFEADDKAGALVACLTGAVEITTQNHGFAVDLDRNLPRAGTRWGPIHHQLSDSFTRKIGHP